jgi:hypothetical protein
MRSRIVKTGSIAASLTVAAAGLSLVQATTASAATSCTTATHYQACATVDSRQPRSFDIGYRDTVINSLNYAITADCQASTAKTIKFGVTAGTKAEVKVAIFGSMEVSLSANIEKSLTTGYVTTAKFAVKAHGTVYCDRGVYREIVKGHSTLSYYGGGAGTIKQYWTAGAPSRAAWHVY